MRFPGLFALLMTLAGTVSAAQDLSWTGNERRNLGRVVRCAERNAVAFTSHPQLFVGTLRDFRERFAPGLSINPVATSVTVGCESSSGEWRLPQTSKEFVTTLLDMSPILARCLDDKRLGRFSHAEGLALSIVKSLDPLSGFYALREVPQNRKFVRIEKPRIEGRNGYLHVPVFEKGMSTHVTAVLRYFRENGVDGLVVDLRGNPGGQISEIVNVLSQFTPRGTLLFSISDRGRRKAIERTSRGKDRIPSVDVAVLVDRSTVSGGELAALALRHLRGAQLVGEPTAGVNSVRTPYIFGGDWVGTIGTGRWIAPGDAVVTEGGVSPDVAVMEADQVLARAFAAITRN